MRYAQIRSMDVSNGEGVGVALFVQGCLFHCEGCFNQPTWDFNGGKEWNEETQKKFLELLDRPYITRCTILGGEPLASQNLNGVLDLVKKIRLSFGDTKTIWLYTGFDFDYLTTKSYDDTYDNKLRFDIVQLCDVLVDGRYEENKRDITLHFRGSSNQRVIDVQKSLANDKVITLYKIS